MLRLVVVVNDHFPADLIINSSKANSNYGTILMPEYLAPKKNQLRQASQLRNLCRKIQNGYLTKPIDNIYHAPMI